MRNAARSRRIVSVPAICLLFLSLAAQAAAQQSPRELYHALDGLRVDPLRVYYVHDLHLRRDVVSLSFAEGKLAFLAPLDGRITGAVFTGRGRAIATPRDPAERRSLAHFLGVPLLDQAFSRAYLRFTDATATELEQQLREAGPGPANEPGFAEAWNPAVANLNPSHSLRVMMDWLSAHPLPYFYAGLVGDISGPFDVLVDNRREEQVILGQSRNAGGTAFYDAWASFPRSDAVEPATEAFAPLDYAIDTAISEDRSLEGKTTIHLRAVRGGERMITLQLSRFLRLEGATDSEGQPLAFFQNEELSRQDVARLGNDSVYVVLPEAARPGQEFRLRFNYRGSVISDAGNGVFFVGARGSWYPHFTGPDHFVPFDLSFRWPRRLMLVATGTKVEEREEGDWRSGRWRSQAPFAVAGFNLGEYATAVVESERLKIELYANRQLEDVILARLRQHPAEPTAPMPEIPGIPTPGSDSPLAQMIPQAPLPSPASVLKQLGRDELDSIHFFEKLNGPFPFEHLAVSQIPGSFGQGWPGLLYLSTFVFLPPEAQERAGLGPGAQRHFVELVPFHELAHQWWGNVVGTASYRDAWIQEAMASYLALLYAESKKPGEHPLANWLNHYRVELLARVPGSDEIVQDAGPLRLGYRLASSKSPDAHDTVIYGKGAWVVHMLRMMLRDPAAKNPDARFTELLQALLAGHRFHALTTADFQHEVEKLMTPAMDLEGSNSMDWFFDQWVSGTGIPRYTVTFQVRPRGTEFLVQGKLRQAGVPEVFAAAVPLYAPRSGGKPLLLGTVVTTGPETTFHFVSRAPPRRILIDPYHTLLCRTE